MKQIIILGGGFAGVWAALAADGALRQHGGHAVVTLVSRDGWLTLRPRLYEAALDGVRVPLDAVLPARVARVEGEVTRIDPSARGVTVGRRTLRYDRLILAAGSQARRPALPGVEQAFGVDTHAEAVALQRHLARLPAEGDGRFTAVVVGAGLTGIETATSLIDRLRAAGGDRARVVLVERGAGVAADLGEAARGHVAGALRRLGVEARTGRAVRAIDPAGVTLDDGTRIAAMTTVWTGGLRASPLAADLGVELDEAGRVPVDGLLRVVGVDGVLAAGDVARALADGSHVAPMSCQHAIPMGERAGRNAVADLLGRPARPYAQPDHVTCLDLGGAGALFMEGWEAEVRLTGFWAKRMKEDINTRLIVPPGAAARDRAA